VKGEALGFLARGRMLGFGGRIVFSGPDSEAGARPGSSELEALPSVCGFQVWDLEVWGLEVWDLEVRESPHLKHYEGFFEVWDRPRRWRLCPALPIFSPRGTSQILSLSHELTRGAPEAHRASPPSRSRLPANCPNRIESPDVYQGSPNSDEMPYKSSELKTAL